MKLSSTVIVSSSIYTSLRFVKQFEVVRRTSINVYFKSTVKSCHLCILICITSSWGFTSGSDSEESACNAEDLGSIPGLERSSGKGNGYLLQYPCLKHSLERGAWWDIVHGITESQIQLSD